MMNKFSIILPVRNGGNHLKTCMKSILQQDYKDYEIIILDNCSTDGSLEWITSLHDPRIRIYPSDCVLDIVANWGRIKEIPKNEFMTMIGHDDLLYPDYLKNMNDWINLYPDASLYQSHFNYIDDSGKIVRPCKAMAAKQFVHKFLESQLTATLDSMGTGYMMRSVDYDRIGGIPQHYPNLIFADYQLWMQLTQLNYKATSPHTLFAYRLTASVSKTTDGEAYKNAFETYLDFLVQFSKTDVRINKAMYQSGKNWLMYNCESLSHRLLKTDKSIRKTSVRDFVKCCITYANRLIPGKIFLPYLHWRILAARLLDNPVGLVLFRFVKRYLR